MNPGRFFGGVAAWAVRHARPLLAVSAIVAVGAAIGASRLSTDAGTGTLVDSGSSAAKATASFHRIFGDDPVEVLVEGDLRNLVLTPNLGRLLRLEGCLSGRLPVGAKPLPGACVELARLKPAKVVYGPATFLNQAVIGIESALGGQIQQTKARAQRAARHAAGRAAAAGASPAEQQAVGKAAAAGVTRQFEQQLLQVAANYGITHLPRLDDPLFVGQVVFDTRLRPGTPKARFGYLFPNRHSALITIRLRPNLSDSERARALTLIREAVFDTTPRKACADNKGRPQPCFQLHGGHYVVSGVPIVVEGLAGALKSALLVLLAAAVLLMAATLGLVFRSRLRLLPLALALATAALTFGLLGLVGGSLTMASIAVLPVLIGLAVDYAIQLQARFEEEVASGRSGAEAAHSAAVQAGPVIATAALATGAGFLALLLSPVPMVRAFGLMLVAGIAIAFFAALTVGFAALAIAGSSSSRRPGDWRRATGDWIRRGAIGRAIGWIDRARAATMRAIRRFGTAALAIAIESPGRVLAVAVALAVCGWVAGTGTSINSDIRQLVPQNLREVKDVKTLQRATGVSGELDVTVHAPDLANPRVIAWMSAFKNRVLTSHGFRGLYPSCRKAQICPGTALTDLFASPSRGLTAAQVRQLIDAIPRYDSQAVVSRDPSTGAIGHTANLAFGIRQMPLDDQERLINDIRSQVDPPGPHNGPPPGVEVRLAGLPVLAADSNADLAGSRYWLALAGLIAVALALLAVYRSVSRALVPLLPIVLATGWSSLVIAAMGIPLNPMSATLGALVIAISTEFSVILASRYREERGGGLSLGESLRRAYARTGAAVLASGATVVVGFAALIASDVRMLRQFGLVTVVDLGVALIGVMLVLPAVLVWAETGFEVGGVPLPRRLAALRR